jgi:hypothetical protein
MVSVSPDVDREGAAFDESNDVTAFVPEAEASSSATLAADCPFFVNAEPLGVCPVWPAAACFRAVARAPVTDVLMVAATRVRR